MGERTPDVKNPPPDSVLLMAASVNEHRNLLAVSPSGEIHPRDLRPDSLY